MQDTQIIRRLKDEMDQQKINAAELAKRAELKPSFIYDILNGKSANPSTLKLGKVAEVLGVDLSYFAGSAKARDAAQLPDEREYITVPHLHVEASAGGGSVVSVEEPGENYYFRREWIRGHLSASPADLRLISVRGDSMEPTLCAGDMVLVDTQRNLPSPPGIFVLYDGFGLVIKRLELIDSATPPLLRIISDNPGYSTYKRAIDEVRIIGRVVWFAREM